jgi:hypothetical protein
MRIMKKECDTFWCIILLPMLIDSVSFLIWHTTIFEKMTKIWLTGRYYQGRSPELTSVIGIILFVFMCIGLELRGQVMLMLY